MQRAEAGGPTFLWAAFITGGLIWLAVRMGPPLSAGGQVRPVAALLAGLAAASSLRLLIRTLGLLALYVDWRSARVPTGKEGTALWGKPKDLKAEVSKKNEGPFWGALADRPNRGLFADLKSNGYVVGPSGVGKGHTAVVPMILSIMHSKIISDFKPELLCICKQALEAMGQIVIALNPFRMYFALVGESHSLNPMDVIVDDLHRPGGLRDVFDDCKELTLQLYPEPADGKGEDKFWRNGSRKLVSLATLIECMLNEYDATLGDVSRLIEDRQAFEDNLRLIVGVDIHGKPASDGPLPLEASEWAQQHDEADVIQFLRTVRGRASSILILMSGGETKTFDAFLEGAEQALEPYAFGKLSSALGRSTFDFDEVKSGGVPVNVFVVGDASRTKATEDFFGLMQWYMQLKLKRHPNKNVPVYLINDEASNYSVYGLVDLMTWGRGFSIRTIQYFQNFASYGKRHGEHAVEVLQSESEIKLFLPGQRASSTIKKIVEILGQQSVMVARLSAEKDGSGLREDMSESARPLATEDEIRRSQHGILIVRQQQPFLQTPISYSEVDPWRDMADINPHHGKPFRHHGLTCPTSTTWVMLSGLERPSTQSHIEGAGHERV